jgi:hypothetical protein
MLSKFFGWAEKHGLRPDGSNPCRHVDKYREGRRERFLSQVELARLGDALRKVEQDKSCSPWVVAAIRLLSLCLMEFSKARCHHSCCRLGFCQPFICR